MGFQETGQVYNWYADNANPGTGMSTINYWCPSSIYSISWQPALSPGSSPNWALSNWNLVWLTGDEHASGVENGVTGILDDPDAWAVFSSFVQYYFGATATIPSTPLPTGTAGDMGVDYRLGG